MKQEGKRVGDAEDNVEKYLFYSHLRIHYGLVHTSPQRVYECVYITNIQTHIRVNKARNMIHDQQRQGLRGLMQKRNRKGSSSLCPFLFLSKYRIPSLSFTLCQLRDELLSDRKVFSVSGLWPFLFLSNFLHSLPVLHPRSIERRDSKRHEGIRCEQFTLSRSPIQRRWTNPSRVM